MRSCALGASVLASTAVVGCGSTASRRHRGAASRTLPLNRDWLFGGKFVDGADQPGFDDTSFSRITLPHCVTTLSWQNWEPAAWEDVWIYRRHFRLPKGSKGRRVFLDFDGVMVSAAPVLNGHALPQHRGGYLPFSYEITDWLQEEENLLAVAIDSRWQDVPPEGTPKGPRAMDYLEIGGIPRALSLRIVPRAFISDVFAKSARVLDSDRSVEVTCSINTGLPVPKPLQVQVSMMDGATCVASVSTTLNPGNTGETEVKLRLSNLGKVKLWAPAAPHLYEIVATLLVDEEPVHEHRTRIGLRDARFESEGFFLNGRRLQLFGLNRHEIYPYVGFAMPSRVMRHDAQMLRREFNCNIVRCSHYPQTEAFLDACDELGLMVWQETPGWGYLGDQAWRDLVVRDVQDMVRRDRNHPSIVIWGVRVNESRNDQELYRRTTEAARSLDGSRPASGSMTSGSRKNWQEEWHEEVFAYDDYHSASDGSVGIDAPVPGVPYMLAEAVGQFAYGSRGFTNKYRRAGELNLQVQQALFHAQAHNKAAAFPRCAGVIAWCAFDYGSWTNSYNGVKCPGVADIFRIPKLGASFYQAQVSPKVRPVIQPDFYWDFGPRTPLGPGPNAAIFSNCDRLEIFINGRRHAAARPDRENFPHLKYPPFFADLKLDGAGHPELRIDGYLGQALAISRSFSSDTAADQLWLQADDAELAGDGSDATRLVFAARDKFGAPRPFVEGSVQFEIRGPGIIVGDNPFSLTDSGGAGAIWIKSIPGKSGAIRVQATHSSLGTKSVGINVHAGQRGFWP